MCRTRASIVVSRACDGILRRVVAEFGAETAPGQVDAGRFAEWFGSQWAGRAPLLATPAREDA